MFLQAKTSIFCVSEEKSGNEGFFDKLLRKFRNFFLNGKKIYIDLFQIH